MHCIFELISLSFTTYVQAMFLLNYTLLIKNNSVSLVNRRNWGIIRVLALLFPQQVSCFDLAVLTVKLGLLLGRVEVCVWLDCYQIEGN